MIFFAVSVRDAAARLPNGEGTRAEICELLKDSQFLAPDVTSAQVNWESTEAFSFQRSSLMRIASIEWRSTL